MHTPAVLSRHTALQTTKAEAVQPRLTIHQTGTMVSNSLASVAVAAVAAGGLEVGVDLEVAAEGLEVGAAVEGLEVEAGLEAAADCRQALQLIKSRS